MKQQDLDTLAIQICDSYKYNEYGSLQVEVNNLFYEHRKKLKHYQAIVHIHNFCTSRISDVKAIQNEIDLALMGTPNYLYDKVFEYVALKRMDKII